MIQQIPWKELSIVDLVGSLTSLKNLTLIIPAKKEAECLPKVLSEIKGLNLETTIILHESDHETIDAIKNFDCKILYQKNQGYGDALILGINSVSTDYFCIFNADGSFRKEELQKMYNAIKDNKNDFVFGSRYMKEGYSEDDTIVTYVGNKIFSYLGIIFFSLPITDILYTFVMGNTSKAKSLKLSEKNFSFCVELPIKAKKANFNLISIPSYEKKRIAGRKHVDAFKDGFIILISMIKLFFRKF